MSSCLVLLQQFTLLFPGGGVEARFTAMTSGWLAFCQRRKETCSQQQPFFSLKPEALCSIFFRLMRLHACVHFPCMRAIANAASGTSLLEEAVQGQLGVQNFVRLAGGGLAERFHNYLAHGNLVTH